jgi:hypothetical protein
MKKRILEPLAAGSLVLGLVLVLGLPWLAGVIVGAVRLAFSAGYSTGFNGLVRVLSTEAEPKARR